MAFVALQMFTESERAFNVCQALDARVKTIEAPFTGEAAQNGDDNAEDYQTATTGQVVQSLAKVDIADHRSDSPDLKDLTEGAEPIDPQKDAHLASLEQLLVTPAMQMHVDLTEAHYPHKDKSEADAEDHFPSDRSGGAELKPNQPKVQWPSELANVVTLLYEADKANMDLAGDLDGTLLRLGATYYLNAVQQQRDAFENKFPRFLQRMRENQVLIIPGNTVSIG